MVGRGGGDTTGDATGDTAGDAGGDAGGDAETGTITPGDVEKDEGIAYCIRKRSVGGCLFTFI